MDMEQDYLMRMIKQMVKALLNVILGRENKTDELPAEEVHQSAEGLYQDLIDLVDTGKINEAEDLLYDKMDPGNRQDMCDALSFYGYLNELEDSYLNENNYTREEIHLGLKNIAKMAGMESLLAVFEE